MADEARRLDGKAAAREIRAEVAAGTARLNEQTGVVPGLSVVRVGDDPASKVYVRNKERAAAGAGMASRILRLPPDTTSETILGTVRALNDDDSVHGILVQLPLPDRVNAQHVLDAVDPDKDVDGFHPVNAGRLLIGLPGFVPCTPAGIRCPFGKRSGNWATLPMVSGSSFMAHNDRRYCPARYVTAWTAGSSYANTLRIAWPLSCNMRRMCS